MDLAKKKKYFKHFYSKLGLNLGQYWTFHPRTGRSREQWPPYHPCHVFDIARQDYNEGDSYPDDWDFCPFTGEPLFVQYEFQI